MAHLPDAHLQAIWQKLTHAVSARSPFTLMQLASVAENAQPKIRTIVLRDFSLAPASLLFTTDVRSAKVQEMRDNPQVSLLGWDAENSFQLRLEGKAGCVDEGELRRTVWQKLRPAAQQLFYSPDSPGEILDDPDALRSGHASASLADPPENIALIRIMIERVESLDVSSEPHQRREFLLRANGWTGRWLVP
ncbi:pyridoxamine 5'-phosphate oxidase family protein [Pantoea eucrina]|uniref:pyridoxamine 5'-phosphate oxidase family protein n=1 Tax=Pantoea eucrina TaxID=472693 RepID=UPI0028A0DA20|nr:pyridoxamine 5'-phosphate oxidase family protein [Pantoea eucrina]